VEIADDTLSIGHWMGLIAGLDAVKERKISFHCRKLNSDP
jgi:hypothetical protein